MPESNTDHIDYYPSGWSEEIHEDCYVEWIYDADPTIFVRLDGTMGENYTVTPITGVNVQGEEFVTKPLSNLDEETAFAAAASMIYGINGAIGRITGQEEFCGEE
jgi:hypothetical protein